MRRFFLAFCAIALAAQQPKPPVGSIAGHVFNSLTGAPIRKATVTLSRSPSPPNVNLVAETDREGAYVFTGLPPGTYRLSAERAGFQMRPLRRIISLGSDENATAADLRLPPQGAINGRVLDEQGDPEPGASITVLKGVFQDGRRQWEQTKTVTANDLGEYRVPDLKPGSYILRAAVTRRQPENRYNGAGASISEGFYYPVYFQSAATQREAAAVQVEPGAELRGIDIRIFKRVRPPSVHVRGRVAGLPPDSPVVVYVGLVTADESQPWGGSATTTRAPDYAFDLTAPPGQYTLRANVYSGGPEAFGTEAVAVAGDVSGVVLALHPIPIVTARVVLPEGAGPAKLDGVKIDIHHRASGIVSQQWSAAEIKVGRSGPARPGRYTSTIDPLSLPEGFYVQKVTLGGQEILEYDFEILASAPLEIVLAKGAAKILGSVVDKDDKPYPVSTVTLIPADSKVRPQRVAADEAGAFNFTGLRPGKYKLFAWDQLDDDLWQDPEFLKNYEERGTEVTVNSGESQTAKLRVIAAE